MTKILTCSFHVAVYGQDDNSYKSIASITLKKQYTAGERAEKVNSNQFNLNYQHVKRMTETDGFVHDGGNWTWDDKIVGNFHSKLSTTTWKFGPNQAWEQDDFNQWTLEALQAGDAMLWDGSYNRQVTSLYNWVVPLLKGLDDYIYANGVSINDENNQLSNETIEGFIPDTIKIYPNPVTATSTIQGAANTTINIYNSNGQELLSKEILTDKEVIDVSSLETGIYYAQVKGKQNLSTLKIIKE